jgi:uncharacterized iron-regulated protein
VYDARAGRDLGFADLFRRLADDADVVFVGEEHDDPETHRAELFLLQGLHEQPRWGNRLTLVLEMFERDGQRALDDYLAGRITEETLGKAVRLWPNYATDYRPLVEYARSRRLPVVGSNAPQRIARDVSRQGASATLAKLPDGDKAFLAAFSSAPDDAYLARFRAIIGEGHGGPALDAAAVRRFYEAQTLKDDTMAESVARLLEASRKVLHVNGAFHSDAGLGVPARVLWRRPLGTRSVVFKIVPVRGDIKRSDAGKLSSEADFLLFVPDRRAAAAKL